MRANVSLRQKPRTATNPGEMGTKQKISTTNSPVSAISLHVIFLKKGVPKTSLNPIGKSVAVKSNRCELVKFHKLHLHLHLHRGDFGAGNMDSGSLRPSFTPGWGHIRLFAGSIPPSRGCQTQMHVSLIWQSRSRVAQKARQVSGGLDGTMWFARIGLAADRLGFRTGLDLTRSCKRCEFAPAPPVRCFNSFRQREEKRERVLRTFGLTGSKSPPVRASGHSSEWLMSLLQPSVFTRSPNAGLACLFTVCLQSSRASGGVMSVMQW